ncbi:hypothetical protein [Streptomyces sp. NPDC002537]
MTTHRPVDVLAARTAETLAAWLCQHPEVRMVCRDRAGSFRDARPRRSTSAPASSRPPARAPQPGRDRGADRGPAPCRSTRTTGDVG